MADGLFKKKLSETFALLRRKDIYLLKMPDFRLVSICSLFLHRNISAWTSHEKQDMIDMAILELLEKIGRRIHPVHHIFHLLGRKNLTVCMPESDFSHIMNDRDIIRPCDSYEDFIHSLRFDYKFKLKLLIFDG